MTYRIFYVSGDTTLVYEFQSATIAHHWDTSVREIKYQVAFNQSEFDSGSITEAVHRDLGSQWLDLVAGFVQEFGSGLLPPDIKQAVNVTELYLGRDETIW